MFSLEEDDNEGLFLTQQPREVSESEICEAEVGENTQVFGIDGLDFTSPNVSVIRGASAEYSDISDADDFQEENNSDTSVR